MSIINYTIFRLNQSILRYFLISLLAATSILNGIVPEVSKSFKISFNITASAQEYRPEEVVNYARAGFAVEILRQQVYTQIKEIIDRPPPNIVCNNPQSFSSLDGNVQQIVINYCNQSREIVRSNNLTISRFNELKNLYDRGGTFYDKVQNILIQIQRQQPKIVNQLSNENYQFLRIDE